MASEGGPANLPSGPEVWRFVDVARREGAIGVSLYDLESEARSSSPRSPPIPGRGSPTTGEGGA